MMRLQYYAFVPMGRRWAELLITRENGKQTDGTPTGVMYPTFKAAQQGVGTKNVEIARGRAKAGAA